MSALLLCLFLVMLCTPCAAQTLACNKQGEQIDATAASVGVKRVSKHVLSITHAAGERRLVDLPPHTPGGLQGEHWQYCGYDSTAQVHLIQQQKDGLLTGFLLEAENGRLVQAGYRILFNADRSRFLAVEQPHGLDGENWTVYTRHGRLVWRGFAGELRQPQSPDQIIAWYESPHWQGRRLIAHLVCSDQMRVGIATLQQVKNEARWQTSLDCRS